MLFQTSSPIFVISSLEKNLKGLDKSTPFLAFGMTTGTGAAVEGLFCAFRLPLRWTFPTTRFRWLPTVSASVLLPFFQILLEATESVSLERSADSVKAKETLEISILLQPLQLSFQNRRMESIYLILKGFSPKTVLMSLSFIITSSLLRYCWKLEATDVPSTQHPAPPPLVMML